jgi:hypothetical protein
MRLLEFASAEEQMALWKLVSDGVWSAIAQQARQQEAERAEKARQAKARAKSKPKSAAPLPEPIPALPPPPLPKPKPLYPNKLTSKPIARPTVTTTAAQRPNPPLARSNEVDTAQNKPKQ